jgi:hypothetical protein
MQEISTFFDTSLSSLPKTTPEDARKVADTYQGLAGVFQRIADDAWARASDGDRESERGNDGEVGFLLDFAEKGKTAVVEVKRVGREASRVGLSSSVRLTLKRTVRAEPGLAMDNS